MPFLVWPRAGKGSDPDSPVLRGKPRPAAAELLSLTPSRPPRAGRGVFAATPKAKARPYRATTPLASPCLSLPTWKMAGGQPEGLWAHGQRGGIQAGGSGGSVHLPPELGLGFWDGCRQGRACPHSTWRPGVTSHQARGWSPPTPANPAPSAPRRGFPASSVTPSRISPRQALTPKPGTATSGR